MAQIGTVETVYLITADTLGKQYETNISKGLVINALATYQTVDTACRALAALSTNTYEDTNLITRVSVNDVIAEDEG